jgi:hypothetical protein
MKVSELIEMLKDLPQDIEVYTTNDCGGIADMYGYEVVYVKRDDLGHSWMNSQTLGVQKGITLL